MAARSWLTASRLHPPVAEVAMFVLSIALLGIAVIAGLFGFTGIAGSAVGMAKIVFIVALIMAIASMIVYRRRSPTR
jgi:uncharacterized membrane protein YtjA (UPF0391 family)